MTDWRGKAQHERRVGAERGGHERRSQLDHNVVASLRRLGRIECEGLSLLCFLRAKYTDSRHYSMLEVSARRPLPKSFSFSASGACVRR